MSSPAETEIWRPWEPATFAAAEVAGRPLLVSIETAWSLGCERMRRSTYRDAAVLEQLDRAFVAVRVDADDRPDIADRYGLGGWPTTAFLTPDGRLLGGQTFTAAEPMVALLTRVADAYARRRDQLAPPVPPTAAPAPAERRLAPKVDEVAEARVRALLLDAFDPEHGGFGRAAKRLDDAALTLAMRRGQEGDDALRAMVATTLDAACDGALFDEVEGGAFRHTARPDWTVPAVEKLLPVNATGLRLLAEAASVLGRPGYEARARAIVAFVGGRLTDGHATGFWGSQAADDAYYALGATDRSGREPPPIDRRVYPGWNAEMARALIAAGTVVSDPGLVELGVEALDRVLAAAYTPGEGLPHRLGEPVAARGLLIDHVQMAEALLEAHAATDRDVYADAAEELMRFVLRHLRHHTGVLVDRRVVESDVGLLRRTLTPFETNCRAAGVLARLAARDEGGELRRRAVETLAGQSGRLRSRGVEAAAYALAARDLAGSA